MIGPIHYFDTESSKSVAFGTPYAQPSTGKVWHYALNGGTALDRGKLAVQATTTANHVNLSFSTAPAIGDREVSVTLDATAAAANLYQDGTLNVQDGTGEGFAYSIEGHAAIASGGTGTFVLGNGESIQVAGATAESNVDLIRNLYSGVVISATDQADLPVGVFNINVAANAYAMIQTWGAAAVWRDETTGIGDVLTTGTGVAGQVEVEDAVGEPLVGMNGANAGVDTEYQIVYLRLDPTC